MASWKWRAYDLASGVLAADLRLSSWQHEDVLNGAGSFSARLEPRDAALTRQAIDATLAARSLIVPFRNGLPIGYGGVVWTPDPPIVSGASLLSYFDDQTYDTTRAFAGVDQHTMMAALVDWVQANDGNVQVDTSQVGLSGVLRDQTWNAWEQKNIGEAFRQKADNINGFDFDFGIELDEGVVVRRLRMWTPRRGRVYVPQACPVFTVGRNARSVPSAPANGAAMATHVIGVGEETNSTTHERLIARAERADLLAAGYPRLTRVLNRPDIKDLTSLQAAVDGEAYYYGAADVDEIVLDVDPNDVTWPWGSWTLGDDCMVKIPVGADPWWPTGFEGIRRIKTHRWALDSAGGERLQVVTGRTLE